MKNLQPLLQHLAMGGEPEDHLIRPLIRREKNAAPTKQLLPSQMAMADMHEGASDAVKQNGAGGFNGLGKDALMGGLQGLATATQAQPMQPMQTFSNPIRDLTIANVTEPMRGLRYGGEVQDGETVRVGEDGEETVTKTADGRVIVNPEQAMKAGIRPDWTSVLNSPTTPMPNGIEQTDQPVQQTQGRTPLINNGTDDLDVLYNDLAKIQTEKGSKWKDAGFGALQGVLNYVNHTNQPIQSYSEMKKAQKAAPILNKIGMLEHRDKLQQEKDWTNTRIATTIEDDLRQREDLKRKLDKDAATVKYWERKADTADFKAATAADLIALRDKWATSKDVNDKRRLDLVEKEMENRNIRSDKDRASREKIAGDKITSTEGIKTADRMQRQQQFVDSYKLKVASELARMGNNMQNAAQWKAGEIRKIEEAVGDGKMDRATADAMLAALQ